MGSTDRFNRHMEVEHGVRANMTYILAGCLMTQAERTVVAQIIEQREENKADKEENKADKEKDKAYKDVVMEVLMEDINGDKKGNKKGNKKDKEDFKEGNIKEKKDTKVIAENGKAEGCEVAKEERTRRTKHKKAVDKADGEDTTQVEDAKDKEVSETKTEYKCQNCKEEFKKLQSLWLHKKKCHSEPSTKRTNVTLDEDPEEQPKQKKIKVYDNILDVLDVYSDDNMFKEKKKPRKSLKGVNKGEVTAKDANSEPEEPFKIAVPKSENDAEPEVEIEIEIESEIESEIKEDKLGKVTKDHVIKESSYFKEHSQDVSTFSGKEGTVKEVENLPPGWRVHERVLASGRKIITFVLPDHGLAFRSRVAVFEYLKFAGDYSDEKLSGYSAMLSNKRRSK